MSKPEACPANQKKVPINLGPWTTAKSVEAGQGKSLTAAMGDEAWKTVEKSCGFSPIEPPKGKPHGPGYTISARLVKVAGSPRDFEVVATFSITVDGQLANVALLEGKARGSGRHGAEDALRAVTESRIKMLLDAVQAGRVRKQG